MTVEEAPAVAPAIDVQTDREPGASPTKPEVGRSLTLADIASCSAKDAALVACAAGLSVIPVVPMTKRTAVTWNTWLDASSSERIVEHWAAHPSHELGCIVGDELLVLDADGPESVAALYDLELALRVEARLVVRTRRGEHHYFRRAPGTYARTSAHSTADHPERIDVKAGRSMVVLPPSTGKAIARCDIRTVAELAEVGQEFIDAVFRHNGSDPPRLPAPREPVVDSRPSPDAPQHERQIGAMLERLDPDCSYDDWLRVLAAIHFETAGSDTGFELADSWSRRGRKYCGQQELRAKWRSFESHLGTPATIGTIRHLLGQQGVEWIEICASTEPGFEPCDGSADECVSGHDGPSVLQLTNVFERFSLRGHVDEVARNVREQVPLIGQLATSGQLTALFGPPNSAKTAVTVAEAIKGIREGRIDPNGLVYVNLDDNASGLLQKLRLAEQFGFHTLAEGYRGFRGDGFLDLLREAADGDRAAGVVIIVDTVKKVVNVMDKSDSTEFLKVARRFVMKGGTMILLAHTNKRLAPDGRPIPGGTSDIRDDVDCAYTLRVISDPDAPERLVEFENVKSRGNACERVVYGFRAGMGLDYQQLLASVRVVEGPDSRSPPKSADVCSEDRLVQVVLQCIAEGITQRMALASAVKQRAGCSRQAALDLMDRYTGTEPGRHYWTYRVVDRGAKVYSALVPGAPAPESNTSSDENGS